ncbi:hypothetical protein XELAEV_18001976mg [Xenopus laevis]|uniref:EGF-like domain-containing protein n=1 Tax=Xenopus laevis TaxID=8355 RepID=A0A974GYE3_XENLA|nr:hypothetical protein XELAEV_18001976mg [Xenopus laevis]
MIQNNLGGFTLHCHMSKLKMQSGTAGLAATRSGHVASDVQPPLIDCQHGTCTSNQGLLNCTCSFWQSTPGRACTSDMTQPDIMAPTQLYYLAFSA